MYLYLVRHGQSEGNRLHTFHGWIDYPLTGEGRRQAREAAEKLREVPFTRCLSSDLRRAWDTAQICLEGRAVRAEPCPGLREQFVGELEGLTWAEMEARYPQALHPFLEDWFHTTPPGGEAPAALAERVGRCVDAVIAAGEDTLLAGHNGSLTMLLLHLGLMEQAQALQPGSFFQQGAYTAVEVTDGGARLLCFNR